jgi:flagellar biogenesis protein FliO
MSPEAVYVVESLATIVVFGGALWVAAWGMRRVSGERGKGPLEILARQTLDARRSIYLVRVGRRVLVVGATDASLTRLGSTSLEAVVEELATAQAEPPRSFRAALSRAVGSRAGAPDAPERERRGG